MLNTRKEVWSLLRPLDVRNNTNFKVVNAISAHEKNERIVLFLLDTNKGQSKGFPKVKVYDLRENCPRLDRHWYYMLKERRETERKEALMILEQYGKDSSVLFGDNGPVVQRQAISASKKKKVVDPYETALKAKTATPLKGKEKAPASA